MKIDSLSILIAQRVRSGELSQILVKERMLQVQEMKSRQIMLLQEKISLRITLNVQRRSLEQHQIRFQVAGETLLNED